MRYVVYWCEHLRDGEEPGARVVETLATKSQASMPAEAEAIINRIANGFAGCNHSFALFELGRQLPLDRGVVETPQPPRTETKFTVRDEAPAPPPPSSAPPTVRRGPGRRSRPCS